MGDVIIRIGIVKEVETTHSKDAADGLRVRAELAQDKAKNVEDIPWAFPLLPKSIHAMPKVGEGVFILLEKSGELKGQRYYLGPIISQPQYNVFCDKKFGTSLLANSEYNPIEKASKDDTFVGAFPDNDDVALVGRGSEDVILKYNNVTKESEVDIRAGIRKENDDNTKAYALGNTMFNGTNPAYIQVKYKVGIATEPKNAANSLVNVVANRINLISNLDTSVEHNVKDNKTLVKEEAVDEVMNNLHQLPKGDELVKLLEIMKNCILTHQHPWAGMEQCGDTGGYIEQLKSFNPNSILSEYVRIS